MTLPVGHVQARRRGRWCRGARSRGCAARACRAASAAPGAVRSRAWTWVFSSTHSTTARVRRVQVEADDVADLVDELRVGGQLEVLDPMRLEPERPPDPGHRGLGHPASPWPSTGSTSASPSGGVLSSVVTIDRSTSSSVIVRGSPGRGSSASPSSRLADEPGPPLAHRRRAAPQLGGDVLVRLALRGGQHDPAPQRQRLRALRASRPPPSVSRSSSLSTIRAVGRPRRAIAPPSSPTTTTTRHTNRKFQRTKDSGH